jgi:hypothetical protein
MACADSISSMVQRRHDSEDPPSEKKSLELDNTHTDQPDDAYRARIVTSNESPNGVVQFDDRGQANWKWRTELGSANPEATGTFNLLKALENPALTLEGEAAPASEPFTKTGYDPYATGVFMKPKTGR